jgi:hypothetical protein
MKTKNPDHPIRKTLKHLALASAMGAAAFLGAAVHAQTLPVSANLALWVDASQLTPGTVTTVPNLALGGSGSCSTSGRAPQSRHFHSPQTTTNPANSPHLVTSKISSQEIAIQCPE